MKKNVFLTLAMFLLSLTTGFSQFFPKVEKPTSPEMSMLALQVSNDEDGKMGRIININFTGWAPAVMNPEGKVVFFRNFDAAADFTNIYYAENLPAGEYKLIGFYHVYTDYDKLEEFKKTVPNEVVIYSPYKDKSYHIKQLFTLNEPVTVNLEPNKIMSFGSCVIKFKWVGGMGGTTTDRWKAVEEKTSVTSDPQNQVVLRYMKTWATPAWKKWNEKNAVSPL